MELHVFLHFFSGDRDDYDAVKHLVKTVEKCLAKETSIHNFNVVTSFNRQPLCAAAWPIPPMGYTSVHVSKNWITFLKHAAMKDGK